MHDIIFRDESYQLIGLCLEVHKNSGMGFGEIIYKDALELEFRNCGIPYLREQKFQIRYKEKILPHYYTADFVVFDAIILEVKALPAIIPEFVNQTIHYLRASGLKLGIIANFGDRSFSSKRVVM